MRNVSPGLVEANPSVCSRLLLELKQEALAPVSIFRRADHISLVDASVALKWAKQRNMVKLGLVALISFFSSLRIIVLQIHLIKHPNLQAITEFSNGFQDVDDVGICHHNLCHGFVLTHILRHHLFWGLLKQ